MDHTNTTEDSPILGSTKKTSAPRRSKVSNVIPFKRSKRCTSRLRTIPRAMHRQEVIGAQLFPFPLGGRDHRVPVLGGNALALPPLMGLPVTDSDVLSELGDSPPQTEQFVDPHEMLIALDSESSKRRITRPVTEIHRNRTIRPMITRTTTPTRFTKQFCERLKAARIVSGLTQDEVAKAINVSSNTYSKYENRSLLPHYLVPSVCATLRIRPDYLFGEEKLQKQAG